MSDETPKSPETPHPPLSKKLKKDASLKMSHSSIEIKQTVRGEIAKVDQASRNNHPLEDIPKYPALHTLSLFANLAYEKDETIRSALVKVEGWQLLTTAHSDNNGYFGAVFWHPANHQIVIAHRGTDPSNIWNDLYKADYRGVYLNNYVDRMSSAATFAEVILTIFDEVEKESNYSIQLFFTGHSLGGWLAQVTTFTTEYLRPMENSNQYLFQNPPSSGVIPKWNYHAHTVVFESPGCAGMLRKMRKSFDISSSNGSIDLNTLDITTYLSAPNIINTCNEHLGTCFRLITDLSELEIKKSRFWPINMAKRLKDQITLEYTRKTHSKEKIQELLSKPTSEVKGKMKEILDWPTLDRKKDYKKLFEEDLFNWANNYHLDPTDVYKCVDEKGLCVVRYQTEDFDERYGYLSIFTPFERKFLERYMLIRDSGLPVIQPHEWLCYLRSEAQKNRATKLLGDFRIEKKKLRCSTVEILNEFVPFVKRLLRLYPSIDDLTLESISAKGNVQKICQFVSQSYRELDVNVESFGVRDFLDGEKRIWHAIARETTSSGKIGITLVYSAFRKILLQKITCYTDNSQYTILNLKHFLNILQLGIDVRYIFADRRHLLIIDCEDLELDTADTELLSQLFKMVDSDKHMKVILVSNSRQEQAITQQIGEHLSGNLYLEKTLPALHWDHLASEYRQTLLEKQVRLAGSSEELTLFSLVGKGGPLALDTDAIMQLIQTKNVITIGVEPQRLSDSEAAYAKRFVTIKTDNLREKLVRDFATLFIIDGLPSPSPHKLIEHLGPIDDEEAKSLMVRISNENEVEKNIQLISGEYSEQKFRQFCHDNPKFQIQWISFKSHSGEWLWKQMYDPTFYIEREMIQVAVPETIKSILCDKKAIESFVVSGIDYNDLLHKLDIDFKDLVETEIERIKSRLSVVTKFEDIRSAKLSYNQSVHLLRYEAPNGSNIRQLVRQVSAPSSETPEEFYILRNEPLSVIVDHPGMGKSTTLTQLTEERLNKNCVMRLNLKDRSSLLHELPIENIEQVSDFIWKATCEEEEEASLAKAIFKHHLRNPKRYVRPLLLLFDGFDEIGLDQQKKVIMMIQLLRRVLATSKHRIVITTRRHPNLEKDLKVLYTVELTLLERKDQITFLKNHWLCRSELMISDLVAASTKSEIYARELLNRADATLREKMAPFIGIPMQLRLLAEGFHAGFMNFANSSSDENGPILNSINIFNIYHSFINAKFDIFYKEKTGFSFISPSVYERWIRRLFTNFHHHLARKILFSKEDKEIFCDNYSLENDELNELYRLGFIQKIRDREEFEFIHFTFVEFFVAEFLVPQLPQLATHSMPSHTDFFYNHILSNPKYELVRNFINSMLAVRGEISDESRENFEGFSGFDSGIFLHVAVREGNSEIIKFFFETLPIATTKTLLSFTPTECDPVLDRTPLHVAAENGHSEIVDILLSKIEEDEKSEIAEYGVNVKDFNGMTPLHFAAKRGHKEVVVILLGAGNIDVNAKDDQKKTPLHLACERGYSDVVRVLLGAGNINVNAKDNGKKTPLHSACEGGYSDVVRVLLRAKDIDLDAREHYFNQTPLHSLIRESDDKEPDDSWVTDRCFLLSLLLSEDIDVNAKDEIGDTALHLAAGSRHIEIVRALLSKKADVNVRNSYNLTPVQIAIVLEGDTEIVRLLLTFGANHTDNKMVKKTVVRYLTRKKAKSCIR